MFENCREDGPLEELDLVRHWVFNPPGAFFPVSGINRDRASEWFAKSQKIIHFPVSYRKVVAPKHHDAIFTVKYFLQINGKYSINPKQ